MERKILLISSNPEDRAFAEAAARIAEASFECEEKAAIAAQKIADQGDFVILVDGSTEAQYQEFLGAIQEKVGLFSDKINSNWIHFISSNNLEKVSYLIQSPVFGSFIFRNYSDPKLDGEFYGRVLRALFADRAFGIQNLVKPGTKVQTKVQVVKLKQTGQKQEAVEAVKNYLIAAKFQTRMAAIVANALDELLMNAMFDAPTDELGKHIYTGVPRSTEMKLEGKAAVEMHIGLDETYVTISVVDYFGSLDKVKLLTHISKVYTQEEYRIRTSVAGAGIGLATVFRSGGSFLFVSDSQVRTEVTVFFKKSESFRDFKDQFKFISTQFYF